MSRPVRSLLQCVLACLALLVPSQAAADLDEAFRAYDAENYIEAAAEARHALDSESLGPDDRLTARQILLLSGYAEGRTGTELLDELQVLDTDIADTWGRNAIERIEILFAISDLEYRLGRRDAAMASYVEIARIARQHPETEEDFLWALGNLAGLHQNSDPETKLLFAALFEFHAVDLLGPAQPKVMEAAGLTALALLDAGQPYRAAQRYFRYDPDTWDSYADLGPWEADLLGNLVAALEPLFASDEASATAAVEAVFEAEAVRQALEVEIADRVEAGQLSFRSAAYAEALAGMNRYLDLAHADDPLVASFSGMILKSHLERGDFAGSRPYLAMVLTYPASYLVLMEVPLPRITAVLARSGGTENALLEAMILKSLDMKKIDQGGDPDLVFDLLFALAEIREGRNDGDGALEAYLDALAMREADGSRYRLTETLFRIGGLLSTLGRHEEAERYHLRLLETARGEGNTDAASSALLSLALGAVELGRPQEAMSYARQSVSASGTDSATPDSDRIFRQVKLATIIARIEEDVTPEFAALVDSIVSVPREAIEPNVAEIRDQVLVEFSRRLGSPDAVRDHPLLSEYDPEQKASLAAMRAEIALAGEDFDEALDWVAFGDETVAVPGDAFFRLREVEGQVALVQGRAIDALLSMRAITDFRIQPGARDVPGALDHLPLHMAAALPLAENPDTGADLRFQREMFLLAQLASQTAASEALNVTLARDMAEGEAASMLRRRASLTRDIASLGSALDRAAADFKTPGEIVIERDRLVEDLRQVNDALRQTAPELASMAALNPLRMEDVAARLDPDEVLAIYVTSDRAGFDRQPASFLVALSRDAIFVTRLPSRTDLTELGHALRCSAALTDPNCGGSAAGGLRGSFSMEPETKDQGPGFDTALAHEAYETLVAPMEELLAGKSRLVIIPDRALVSLPFHLLLQAPLPEGASLKDGRWLIRDYAVGIAPSVQSLVRGRDSVSGGPGGDGYLGIGDPLIGLQRNGPIDLDCGDDTAPPLLLASATPGMLKRSSGAARVHLIADMGALPEARCELGATARLFERSELLLHGAATETTLKQMSETGALRQFSVLGFATHGLVAGEIGVNDSGLVLTPPQVPTARDDGLLTTAEIAGLDLDAEFVILSACNTASGDSTNDEALSGLATAFFVAGARSLVVSHWPVYSDAAVAVTTQMFDALRDRPDLPRSEALRLSMLSVLDDPATNARQEHPSYWGAFMLVGGGRGL